MSSTIRWMLILAIIVCAAIGLYLLSHREAPQQPSQHIESSNLPPPISDESNTLTRHPVPPAKVDNEEAATPLPALEDSDGAIHDSLGHLFNARQLDELLVFKNFINRMVVTIDNLPRAKFPVQHLPGYSPRGKFLVKKMNGDTTVIDPDNYKRYAKYVEFIEKMDSRKLAAVYFHFYPLFQQAYSDLGYKSAYFNDRLIDTIDDMLATPDVKDPIQVIQPSVFYKYADPKLEGLSAGQKLMIRIGNDNATKIKKKLRELRDALTQHSPKS